MKPLVLEGQLKCIWHWDDEACAWWEEMRLNDKELWYLIADPLNLPGDDKAIAGVVEAGHFRITIERLPEEEP